MDNTHHLPCKITKLTKDIIIVISLTKIIIIMSSGGAVQIWKIFKMKIIIALPPSTLLVQETPSPLYTGCPTETYTDMESPQMCRISIRRHGKTPKENQVSQ